MASQNCARVDADGGKPGMELRLRVRLVPNGQQLKCLTVTDEWTAEGLAIEVDGRIRSTRVIEVLARFATERGAPLYLRSDNVLSSTVVRC